MALNFKLTKKELESYFMPEGVRLHLKAVNADYEKMVKELNTKRSLMLGTGLTLNVQSLLHRLASRHCEKCKASCFDDDINKCCVCEARLVLKKFNKEMDKVLEGQ